MTQIIGFAGKKQSGKNTSCNFITMLKMKELGLSEELRINEETGELEVKDVLGQTAMNGGWFSFTPGNVNIEGLYESVGPFCKIYALADTLKSIAIQVLGLPASKVYGTDADKSELTHLLWENMPGVVAVKDYETQGAIEIGELTVHEPGPMTIREVLQYMGTEIFRKMYETVWVDSLLRKIKAEEPEIAVICDVRFPNEINLLRDEGAIILGLSRDIFDSKDTHASEQIDFSLCSLVIDNQDMEIEDQCKAIYEALQKLGCKNLPHAVIGS
jgi:hypothetical protein